MTGWSIRDGRAEDAGALLELWRLAGSVPTVSDDEASLALLLGFDPESLLVAELDGRIVGSLITGWDGWRGSFYRLAVRPGHRRRGLASELVRIGEDRLRRRGAVRLNAIVASEEAAALGFWEALGYVRQPGQLRFVRDLETLARTNSARSGPRRLAD